MESAVVFWHFEDVHSAHRACWKYFFTEDENIDVTCSKFKTYPVFCLSILLSFLNFRLWIHYNTFTILLWISDIFSLLKFFFFLFVCHWQTSGRKLQSFLIKGKDGDEFFVSLFNWLIGLLIGGNWCSQLSSTAICHHHKVFKIYEFSSWSTSWWIVP